MSLKCECNKEIKIYNEYGLTIFKHTDGTYCKILNTFNTDGFIDKYIFDKTICEFIKGNFEESYNNLWMFKMWFEIDCGNPSSIKAILNFIDYYNNLEDEESFILIDNILNSSPNKDGIDYCTESAKVYNAIIRFVFTPNSIQENASLYGHNGITTMNNLMDFNFYGDLQDYRRRYKKKNDPSEPDTFPINYRYHKKEYEKKYGSVNNLSKELNSEHNQNKMIDTKDTDYIITDEIMEQMNITSKDKFRESFQNALHEIDSLLDSNIPFNSI